MLDSHMHQSSFLPEVTAVTPHAERVLGRDPDETLGGDDPQGSRPMSGGSRPHGVKHLSNAWRDLPTIRVSIRLFHLRTLLKGAGE